MIGDECGVLSDQRIRQVDQLVGTRSDILVGIIRLHRRDLELGEAGLHADHLGCIPSRALSMVWPRCSACQRMGGMAETLRFQPEPSRPDQCGEPCCGQDSCRDQRRKLPTEVSQNVRSRISGAASPARKQSQDRQRRTGQER